jgi:hypothetical protein
MAKSREGRTPENILDLVRKMRRDFKATVTVTNTGRRVHVTMQSEPEGEQRKRFFAALDELREAAAEVGYQVFYNYVDIAKQKLKS